MKTPEEAVALHGQGFNCAQCVLLACGKVTGLDPETAGAVAAGFGGGLRSGEICGAISGAVMAVGLCEKNKAAVAAATKACVTAFRDAFGAVRCAELKNSGVSCDRLIAFGAAFMDDRITNNQEQE